MTENPSKKPKKRELQTILDEISAENARLRDSVARLMLQHRGVSCSRPAEAEGDIAAAGWPERYGIVIPRADGLHESDLAWVRVKGGVITHAELKDASILSRLVHREFLDPGAVGDAKTYADWRAAFAARLEDNSAEEHGKDGPPSAWTKEDRFQKLNRKENRARLRLINLACLARPLAQDAYAALAHPRPYQDAFEWLHDAIRDISRGAKRATEEGAGDDCAIA